MYSERDNIVTNESRLEERDKSKSVPLRYWNPYVAGIGLGFTLLAAFVIMGRGLGASGGYTAIVSTGVHTLAPEHAEENGMYSTYLESRNPLKDWLVFEIIGVLVGGFLSGLLARRLRVSIVRGPRMSSTGRLFFAFGGGALMGFAAKIARGCTSGQALTGGALLSVGSWVFMISIFIGAYAVAHCIRRQWT
jgi:hypothetical protein